MKKAAITLAMILGSTGALTFGTSQAFAQDPPETPPTPPPSAPPETPAPAAPPAAETPTTPPPEPPAATFSVGTPSTADQPSTTTPPVEEKKAPRAFAGSSIFAQTSMTTATVFKGQQQYDDPTGEVSVYFSPRYAINKDFQLRGRLPFNYEFTNSDTTKTKYEPRFGDLLLQLMYRGIPEVATIKPLVGASVGLPVSPESRARTLYVSPGITASLAKHFEKVIGGEVDLVGGATFSHPLYAYTTPQTRDDTPYHFQCAGAGQGCEGQLSGTENAANVLSWTFVASAEWGKWSPSIFVLGTHQWAYRPKDIPDQPPSNAPRVRQSTYFAASIDYNVTTWISPEIGYFMYRNVLGDDGTYGNPIFNPYQDTRVYIGANVNIDNFVEKVIQKEGDGKAGVVRARAASPALGF